MMILELLAAYGVEQARDQLVSDIRIGLSYTFVQLEDGRAGVAMTAHREPGSGCIHHLLPHAGQKAADIIARLKTNQPLEKTVALATLNAVCNREDLPGEHSDVLEYLEPFADDIVGMVGYFGPLVPQLRKRAKELRIFEKQIDKASGLISDQQMAELLPECTLLLVTSTSLLNDTFEGILRYADGSRKTALVGASTPLVPEVFSSYPLDSLSGVIVSDIPAVRRVISEAGGMKSFKHFITKINLACTRSHPTIFRTE